MTKRSRIDEEKAVAGRMIRLYCRHKEGNRHLCEECRRMAEYVNKRLSKCPFGNAKPTCRKCTVHCYRPDMHERICTIMRYAGPRMALYHPVMAIRHALRELTCRKVKGRGR